MSHGVVFFASGKGRLFEASARHVLSSDSGIKILALITQNADACCAEKARALGVPVYVLPTESQALKIEMEELLKKLCPLALVLTGFTRKIPESVVKAYPRRILNSHPSLLPKYGGKGMYGQHVHAAVLASGESTTGVSLHEVTLNYDEGPVIAQLEVPVLESDDVHSLSERVQAAERDFFPAKLLSWLEELAKDDLSS